MFELRWLVPSGTYIPGREWPKLQYRVLTPTVDAGMNLCPGDHWTEWTDVPTVVADTATEGRSDG